MATNNNDKTLNVPHLRFPEFSGEWENYKLQDICNLLSGGTPALDNPNYWNGNIPFISAATMHNSYIVDSEQYLSDEGLARGSKLLQQGNLLLLVRGSMLWKHIPICYNKLDVAFNQDVKGIITNKFSRPLFLLYWFESHESRMKYMVTGTGIGAGKLDTGTLLSMNVSLPSQKEQERIISLLQLLDERIATQNKIIDKLKSLIKGLIDDIITLECGLLVTFETLYSKAGEGGTPTTSNMDFYDNGNIPFIKIEDLNNKYLLTNKDYITELGLKKSSAWLIPTNSIIYSNGATIGAISINKYPICTKQGILGIIPNSNIDVEYLYYFMRSSYFQKEVERIVTEGTMKTAYLKDINHIKCPIPDSDKQKEISHALSTLSLKENIENQLLKKYQIQKQYLLSQMFI